MNILIVFLMILMSFVLFNAGAPVVLAIFFAVLGLGASMRFFYVEQTKKHRSEEWL